MVKKIKSKLKSLMEQREFEGQRVTYTDIRRATGISLSALSEFGSNKTSRYHEDLLAALCEYFGCQVGDLLEYVPPQAGEGESRRSTSPRVESRP